MGLLDYLKFPLWTAWRFLVDFRLAVRNTIIVLIAFGRTVVVGGHVIRTLRRRGRAWDTRTRGRVVWGQAHRDWGQWIIEWAGIRLSVVGLDRVDWSQPHVIVSNHQSTLDIVVIAAVLPDGRFVAKKEILAYPYVGSACRDGGQVLIDRANHGQAMATIRDGMRAWPDCNLLFFAEGSRTQTGALGEFKKGAFAIARETGLPIVPVAIDGTFAALPKGSLLRLRRNPVVRVQVGFPVAPVEEIPELTARVRSIIKDMIEGTYAPAEAGPPGLRRVHEPSSPAA
jgi:1-acyl-sn-glycerol-3-phosphate acyltransferase